MEKLRIGVAGAGFAGGWHIKQFQAIEGCDVIACADPSPENLKKIQVQYNIPHAYADFKEMLEKQNLDVVSIATPNKFHAPFSIAALEAGCHVMCEKPMATHALDAEKMLSMSEKKGKLLMIHFNYVFSEMVQNLKHMVDADQIGTPYFGRSVWHRRWGMPGFGGWFGQKELSGGGPLIDLGVHRLGMALYLMGSPKPMAVSGAAYHHIGVPLAKALDKPFDVEDLAAGFVRFDNGSTLILEASWAAGIEENQLMETRIMGTKGGLVQKNINGNYDQIAEVFTRENGAFLASKYLGSMEPKSSAFQNFVDCVRTGGKPLVDGRFGLYLQYILDALYRSAEEGKEIAISSVSSMQAPAKNLST